MTLDLAELNHLAWQWVVAQEHLPQGVYLESGNYKSSTREQLFFVNISVRFPATSERKKYRLVTLTISDDHKVSVTSDRTEYVLGDLLQSANYEILPSSDRVAKFVQPFGRKNPPQFVTDAIDRITNELEPKKVRIKTQLAERKAEEFASPEHYASWKSSAECALGQTAIELTYLNRWIKAQTQPEETPKPAGKTPRVPPAALPEELSADALGKLQELQKKWDALQVRYVPVYTEERGPGDVATARERKMELAALARECTDTFKILNDSSEGQVISSGKIAAIKVPLLTLSTSIATELRLLNHYLRDHGVNVYKVLIQIIERLARDGAVLTNAEQYDFDQACRIYHAWKSKY